MVVKSAEAFGVDQNSVMQVDVPAWKCHKM